MGKNVFATQFNIFKGDKYTKIDFFDLEPTDQKDEKGNVTVVKGEVTRITLPNDIFNLLELKAHEMNAPKKSSGKNAKK